MKISVDGGERHGTGFAVSDRLVLTCAHVVGAADVVTLRDPKGRELQFAVVERDPELDAVLLMPAPSETRTIAAQSIAVPRRLWGVGAWSSVDDDLYVETYTTEADLMRRTEVKIPQTRREESQPQFNVIGAREGIRKGYSGSPLLKLGDGPDGHVVGMVRMRDKETLGPADNAGVGWFIPIDRLADRFPALAAWVETPVEHSGDWESHWEPRSRGVVHTGDAGYFFSGHRAAYDKLRDHLASPGGGLAAVTGDRARGKSGLLARAVVLSCSRFLAKLGADGAHAMVDGYRPLAVPVDAAVVATDRTFSDVQAELARQLGVKLKDRLASALDYEKCRSVTVVIDGVDEALDPPGVLLRLARSLAQAGARVALGGSRRCFLDLRPEQRIDLNGKFRDDRAVRGYVVARLTRGGPYDETTVEPIAHELDVRADGNFLYAELTTRDQRARGAIETSDPDWKSRLPGDVAEAFRVYLDRIGEKSARALDVLEPLALARGDGLGLRTGGVWLATANALRDPLDAALTVAELSEVVGAVDDYLVRDHDSARWKLFHEGLGEAVRRLANQKRLRDDDDPRAEQTFARVLEALLPAADASATVYADVDPYLLEHLPAHLAAAGRAEELLTRPGLILTANVDALMRALVLGEPTISPGYRAVRIAIVHALASRPGGLEQRAAAILAALRRQREGTFAKHLRSVLPPDIRVPYELLTGPPLPALIATRRNAHAGGVLALAAHGNAILSGGEDGMVRSWTNDLQPGSQLIGNAHDRVWTLAVTADNGRPLLLSGGGDGALRSWRLTGSEGSLYKPHAHVGGVRAIAVAIDDGPLIVSASDDGAIYSWRTNGSEGPLRKLHAHVGGVRAVAVAIDDGPLIVSAGDDGAICSWRANGSEGPLRKPHAHDGWITALVVTTDGDRPLIVSAGEDRAIRSWHTDGSPGLLNEPRAHGGWVTALAVTTVDNRPLIVSAGGDGSIASWRADGTKGPLREDRAHAGWIWALSVDDTGDHSLIVSAGDDGAIHTWRADGDPSEMEYHGESVRALPGRGASPMRAEHRATYVSIDDDPLYLPDTHIGGIWSMTSADHEGRPLILSGGEDGSIHSWCREGTPGPLQWARAHDGGIRALLLIVTPDGPLIVSAGDDGVIRSWSTNGFSPGCVATDAHQSRIRSMTWLADNGISLLVSSDEAGHLRGWHPGSGKAVFSVDAASSGPVAALGHLVLLGGEDGSVRSWRSDGQAGGFVAAHGHVGPVQSLAVIQHGGAWRAFSAGKDGAIRSWREDGSPDGFGVDDAHSGPIEVLRVLVDAKGPLIISGGTDGMIRSWRPGWNSGPVHAEFAHDGLVRALIVVPAKEGQLLVSAGDDGMIRASHLDAFAGIV